MLICMCLYTHLMVPVDAKGGFSGCPDAKDRGSCDMPEVDQS